MPFYGNRLLSSDFDSRASDAQWRAAVCLWWAAWNQIPGASLPDDDVTLAKLANLGRDVRTWKRLREVALHGFVKCTDGRFYHRVLAPLAIDAYARRKAERDKKTRYRSALANPSQHDLLGDGSGPGTGTGPGEGTGTGRSQAPLTGTETVKGKEGRKPYHFIAPEWLPLQEFEEFAKMRQRIRKPLTDWAKHLVVLDLQGLREKGFDPAQVLNQSTKKSWQGVFEIRDSRGGAGGTETEQQRGARDWAGRTGGEK